MCDRATPRRTRRTQTPRQDQPAKAAIKAARTGGPPRSSAAQGATAAGVKAKPYRAAYGRP